MPDKEKKKQAEKNVKPETVSAASETSAGLNEIMDLRGNDTEAVNAAAKEAEQAVIDSCKEVEQAVTSMSLK